MRNSEILSKQNRLLNEIEQLAKKKKSCFKDKNKKINVIEQIK